MVDDLSIPPEVAELAHREEMLRRAGEELLEEARTLRAKYEDLVGQLRKSRAEQRTEADIHPGRE